MGPPHFFFFFFFFFFFGGGGGGSLKTGRLNMSGLVVSCNPVRGSANYTAI